MQMQDDINVNSNINTENVLDKLEKKIAKVSELFTTSVNELRTYVPLDGEENMANSQMNRDRIQVENIQNYEINSKNYNEIVKRNAESMNNLFDEIGYMINELKNNTVFNTTTDEDLKNNLEQLKNANNNQAKIVQDKIKSLDELIHRVKTESEIDKQFENRTENNNNPYDDLELQDF
jgi:hypothetical protein